MSSFVFNFEDLDQTKLQIAGGKGANLGELAKIDGISVPGGFCLSTEAFQKIIGESPAINYLLDQLSLLKADDRDQISKLSAQIRQVIEEIAIPQNISEEVIQYLSRLGENEAYAIRSSATAEDLPAASFAGQQDSYLNIVGKESILKHISKCWASLYTERAIIYRLQNGFDHRQVQLAVIVQKMIFSQAAGIMFTADPVTSNRKILSIDAGFGLGEAMVSGLVNPDNYKVSNGAIIDQQISAKKMAIYPAQNGGTIEQGIDPARQNLQVLTDEQILQLEGIGRKIEAHFGRPQDIEWCLADEMFYIVQSRPITTLFPVPEANDEENHVYVSVGHQQMMTDPIKPLGLSLFQLTAFRPMSTAGGRLFVDIAENLTTPSGREMLINVLGNHDPLIKDSMINIVGRENFIKFRPDETGPAQSNKIPSPLISQEPIENDPAIVTGLIQHSQESIAGLKSKIAKKSGTVLFDFILEDLKELKQILFDPQSSRVFMAAINASAWVNEKMFEWLGEKNAADTLSQSVPNNITSEMGLALLDVADVIRPFPEVIEYLQQTGDENFSNNLDKFEGGHQARTAINAFLEKYGMRCAGEIDITRTRWSEKPSILIPVILNHIKNFGPQAGRRKFEQGLQKALKMERDLLDRLKRLPDGESKAFETKQKIDLIRNYIGYREYPKYGKISRYFVYKQAILQEADRLVRSGVIRSIEDIYYLTFEELREVVRTDEADYHIIDRRKEDYKLSEKLTPPRVMTSDGEIVAGQYKRENLPPGALVGLPVSAGVIEGRARVIFRMEDAVLDDGDILVTPFTDPSWTPLFVSIKGLVTEVGGLMTHGAVIAREYGLPAVVGVENASKIIKEGQRIRVHGTEGYVEILSTS